MENRSFSSRSRTKPTRVSAILAGFRNIVQIKELNSGVEILDSTRRRSRRSDPARCCEGRLRRRRIPTRDDVTSRGVLELDGTLCGSKAELVRPDRWTHLRFSRSSVRPGPAADVRPQLLVAGTGHRNAPSCSQTPPATVKPAKTETYMAIAFSARRLQSLLLHSEGLKLSTSSIVDSSRCSRRITFGLVSLRIWSVMLLKLLLYLS
ncbi:hypothetical protein NL676_000286 [Syzygium grande]|nr:hypothetical protein NL676_000286 [Syzygium grande]